MKWWSGPFSGDQERGLPHLVATFFRYSTAQHRNDAQICVFLCNGEYRWYRPRPEGRPLTTWGEMHLVPAQTTEEETLALIVTLARLTT